MEIEGADTTRLSNHPPPASSLNDEPTCCVGLRAKSRSAPAPMMVMVRVRGHLAPPPPPPADRSSHLEKQCGPVRVRVGWRQPRSGQ